MVADDLTKGEHVYGEEEGTKDRTLWHTMVNSGWVGAGGYKSCFLRKVLFHHTVYIQL